jgi:PPIC-type PPIASE domain
MRKLLREPLLHFLVLGLALFLLFNVVSGAKGGADRRIVVNDAAVANIVRLYQGAWKRPVTTAELQGLIDSHVREEVLFREGVAMGLDRDDPVIRRRVLQKMGVITEESIARLAPADAELENYLRKHAERYRIPALVGFEQVMFDPVRHGSRLDADLAAALLRLRGGTSPDTMGDSSLLPALVATTSADLVARDFGDKFAASVIALPLGTWSGPVASGYGVHLVRVTSMTPGRPATLAEVRAAVEGDWENDRRLLANEDYYKQARRKYDVVIDADLAAARTAGALD